MIGLEEVEALYREQGIRSLEDIERDSEELGIDFDALSLFAGRDVYDTVKVLAGMLSGTPDEENGERAAIASVWLSAFRMGFLMGRKNPDDAS